MNQLLSIRSFLVVILGLISTLASARTISDLDAVHKAAVQRTLAMRIAKDHLQMAANVDYQAARAGLDANVEEFEFYWVSWNITPRIQRSISGCSM